MRIMAYGDSNTFGIGPMPDLDRHVVHAYGTRWVDHLAAALPEADVIVEGLPGRTTLRDDPIEGAHKNGLTVLPALIESHRPLDLLILCLGTNDFKARFNVPAQEVAMGLGRLTELALASGHVAQVLVIVPPVPISAGDFATMFSGVETRAKGFEREAARFCGKAGAGLLDAGALISCDPTDGIHWDASAHQTLGRAVAAWVKDNAS